MVMRKPRALRPGDTISLVSPASPVSPEQCEKAINILLAEGYKVKSYPSTFAREDYLAGCDLQRAADLAAAFDDPETSAVYCARGGYGCSRLLPHLDLDRLAKSDKMLIGFSDITVLHAAWNRRGMATLHAPMALTLNTDRLPWVYESFKSALKGENPIPESAPFGISINGGEAIGETAGGCLILVTDLLGTPEQLDLTGKILVLEDVDEAPHRVDAMLTHLLNSGTIQKAVGIVIGEMTRTDDRVDKTIGGRHWREIVSERLASLNIPIIMDFPMGHAAQMLSLPLGIPAKITSDIKSNQGKLEYLESLCK
jgi:muramoyltetrapeptide carboxypeptidase